MAVPPGGRAAVIPCTVSAKRPISTRGALPASPRAQRCRHDTEVVNTLFALLPAP